MRKVAPRPGTRTLRDADDLVLAHRAAGGDRAAFAVLVRRHEARLRGFLVGLAGRELADEIAQETFLRAGLRAGEYRGEGAYPGWLTRIAWNLHCDMVRKAARRDRLAAPAPEGEPMVMPTTDAAIDARRLLATLDDRTRAALILCDGHGWSHGEAAAMLDVPVGTLKSLVLRAKARLRAAFAERETA